MLDIYIYIYLKNQKYQKNRIFSIFSKMSQYFPTLLVISMSAVKILSVRIIINYLE